MKLIIAEKPSVAKSIASALGAKSRADGFYEGNGLLVSWCVGHLVSPLDAAGYDESFKKWRYDDLPILPEPFRYVTAPGKEDAFENLRSLMDRPDVDTVVNACDAGREGELIFRLVYEMAGCRKPILRLWISSMEDTAIREGFSELRPSAEYEALYQSALCRQKADWLVGINATRLFSVLYHRTLNVGRVQTPTLAMLAERDARISGFQKEKYHHVRLKVGGAEAVSEKITDPAEAEQIKTACAGAPVTCTSVSREQKKEQPPKLYDLTTLQREANRMFGYTAKQTLDYAQSLYEAKLLTYPRTDSRYLTSDMAETASCVIHLAAKVPPFDGCASFFPLVELMISDKDVSDHHAIIPTMEIEKADIGALPVGERNLLLLVCCKLLCAAAEPYVYETVTATFDCGGHSFTAKGKHILSEGWREIDRVFRSPLKEKQADKDSGGDLPDFTEGQPYEEWFITDYDCYVDGLYDKLGEYESLDELNYLASKLDEMSQGEYEQFQAAMEIGDHSGSVQEIINLTENLDCYDVYPDIHDYDDLGRYYIDELDAMQVPEHLKNYIDYEAYGRDVALDESGDFTDLGYVRDTGSSFHEYYDGDRGSIPEEYRVMTFQDDIPEEELSEWAMDIAFDMDEYFRQHDPQYAAEHPEAHEAKEDIYENLMAGQVAAFEEKLAALGQTTDDYLPSELEKYKEASGYEAALDTSMAEIQEEPVQEDSFSIYQLKGGDETLNYRFEPLDAIRRNGLSVDPANYELVYTAPLTAQDSLEGIYTRFNVDRPADFTGHSLSVSDIVVLHQDGTDTAHYCDRFGFSQVPEFLEPERAKEATIPTPDQMETGETVRTPRGSFYVTAMSREQMEAVGYGLHHQSDDGKYLIMGDGTRAFAVLAEQPEKNNPLRTAEMTLEDDYGMIDGVINNGRRGEEVEKKPSIRERLEDARQECSERKPPEKGRPVREAPEHGYL